MLSQYYNYYFFELGEPKLKENFLVNTPIPTLVILTIYFLLIYLILPFYIKDRKPYELKTFIFCYNVFQVVACSYFVYELLTPLSDPLIELKCTKFEYENSVKAQRRSKLFFYIYLVKIAELVETILFILRKKFKQVSGLHVYHHGSTLLVVWFLLKYFAGPLAAFWFMLNCMVHVLMYVYYLFASLGPKWQQQMNKFKVYMTMIQMVQFTCMFIHALQIILNPECNQSYSSFTFFVVVPDLIFLFYMFAKFFKATYMKNEKTKIK